MLSCIHTVLIGQLYSVEKLGYTVVREGSRVGEETRYASISHIPSILQSTDRCIRVLCMVTTLHGRHCSAHKYKYNLSDNGNLNFTLDLCVSFGIFMMAHIADL